MNTPPRLVLPILALLICAPWSHARSMTPVTSRTGAPGHSTCADCHGGPGNGSVSLKLSAGDTYEPGQLYSMEVTISDPGQMRFGFQMVARSGANKDIVNAGTWSTSEPNTQTYGQIEQHVAHLNAPFPIPDTKTYTVNWEAPPADTGEVTFYVAANAANGNGSSSGDRIYTTTLTISEFTAPAPPPTLTDVVILPDKSARMVLGGTPGLIYHLEFLNKDNEWTFLQEIDLRTKTQLVTDLSAANALTRLYRARKQDP